MMLSPMSESPSLKSKVWGVVGAKRRQDRRCARRSGSAGAEQGGPGSDSEATQKSESYLFSLLFLSPFLLLSSEIRNADRPRGSADGDDSARTS
ncbi:hypothetical protein B0H11DRAFT_2296451 [Mycena galericulata]|nr:hypothetical protein B0H11DRAFT_2296451 [Mycena galericulata]